MLSLTHNEKVQFAGALITIGGAIVAAISAEPMALAVGALGAGATAIAMFCNGSASGTRNAPTRAQKYFAQKGQTSAASTPAESAAWTDQAAKAETTKTA